MREKLVEIYKVIRNAEAEVVLLHEEERWRVAEALNKIDSAAREVLSAIEEEGK